MDIYGGLQKSNSGIPINKPLEWNDHVGGSTHFCGGPVLGVPGSFLLDRGFQILIEAYPEVKRQLDLKWSGSKNEGEPSFSSG